MLQSDDGIQLHSRARFAWCATRSLDHPNQLNRLDKPDPCHPVLKALYGNIPIDAGKGKSPYR
jgi:hypothetical protein